MLIGFSKVKLIPFHMSTRVKERDSEMESEKERGMREREQLFVNFALKKKQECYGNIAEFSSESLKGQYDI